MAKTIGTQKRKENIDEIRRQIEEEKKLERRLAEARDKNDRLRRELEDSVQSLKMVQNKAESYDDMRNRLMEIVDKNEVYSMDVLLAGVDSRTASVIEQQGIRYDPMILDMVERNRWKILNEILDRFRTSPDFKEVMVLFKILAPTEWLEKIDPKYKFDKKKGDEGTMFDVRVISSREEAAQYADFEDVKPFALAEEGKEENDG